MGGLSQYGNQVSSLGVSSVPLALRSGAYRIAADAKCELLPSESALEDIEKQVKLLIDISN